MARVVPVHVGREPVVEFIQYVDALKPLSEIGVREIRGEGSQWKRFDLVAGKDVHRLHLCCGAEHIPKESAGETVHVSRERLPELVLHVLNRLRLHDVLLIPFSPWRKTFDAVAFNLADNKAWQEVDAMASVELNSHDPLQCDCGDFNTMKSLMTALLKDGDSPDQSLTIVAPRTPILMEFCPQGRVTIAFGNPAVARELSAELAERA